MGEKMIATRTQEKDDEIVLMNNNKIDLKTEVDYKTKITPDCDWIIGAWAKRAKDRTAEREGLVSAKEYLVGYQTDNEANRAELNMNYNEYSDLGLVQKASRKPKFND